MFSTMCSSSIAPSTGAFTNSEDKVMLWSENTNEVAWHEVANMTEGGRK